MPWDWIENRQIITTVLAQLMAPKWGFPGVSQLCVTLTVSMQFGCIKARIC